MGVFLIDLVILTGVNFIATTTPCAGDVVLPVALLSGALYATSIIMVLATPVIGITMLLPMVEYTLHLGIFDPKYGGDPVLFHFFWFLPGGKNIMILPGWASAN